MSQSTVNMILDLCDILVQSNLQICDLIKGGGYNKSSLFDHFNSTAKIIKKLSKIIESQSSFPTENQEEGRKDDKLMARIKYIKQNRQKRIENDKKWSEMNDENDELIVD